MLQVIKYYRFFYVKLFLKQDLLQNYLILDYLNTLSIFNFYF